MFCNEFREHRQKTFVTLSRFWPLRGWGGRGGLSEFVKKGKFVKTFFFQIMLYKALKTSEK